MIKLEKDINAIPASLIPAIPDLFPGYANIPLPSRTTHKRRMEVIIGSLYINENKYNNRYKYADIKNALNDIYNSKCAYCEMKVEQLHVEHYRPKDIYYWLAYSWDNLIIACSSCNTKKGTHFELGGSPVVFENNDVNIRGINTSSAGYDLIEQPQMVNPEVTDPEGHIRFTKAGEIESDDDRFVYTIDKCGIDRTWLNDERRGLLEIFKRDITSILLDNDDPSEQEIEIRGLVRKFVNDSKDKKSTFLAFRRFTLTAGWLNEIVKDLN